MDPDSAHKIRVTWSESMRKAFINGLLKEAEKVNCTDGHFKKASWQRILDGFIKDTGLNVNKQQLHNQFGDLKKKYVVFKRLTLNHNFVLDPNNNTVSASSEVWENYLEQNPAAKEFQYKTLNYFEELDSIFAGCIDEVPTGAAAARSRASHGSYGHHRLSRGGEDDDEGHGGGEHVYGDDAEDRVMFETSGGGNNTNGGGDLETISVPIAHTTPSTSTRSSGRKRTRQEEDVAPILLTVGSSRHSTPHHHSNSSSSSSSSNSNANNANADDAAAGASADGASTPKTPKTGPDRSRYVALFTAKHAGHFNAEERVKIKRLLSTDQDVCVQYEHTEEDEVELFFRMVLKDCN